MNELQIFNSEEFRDIRTVQEKAREFEGFVYALECSSLIKIGCTQKPYDRIKTLKKILGDYGGMNIGRILLSIPHTNFRQNEKVLHNTFSRKRVDGTELFSISFYDAVFCMLFDLECRNESSYLQRKADKGYYLLKSMAQGTTYKKHINLEKMSYTDAEIILKLAERYEKAKNDYLEFLEKFVEQEV